MSFDKQVTSYIKNKKASQLSNRRKINKVDPVVTKYEMIIQLDIPFKINPIPKCLRIKMHARKLKGILITTSIVIQILNEKSNHHNKQSFSCS